MNDSKHIANRVLKYIGMDARGNLLMQVTLKTEARVLLDFMATNGSAERSLPGWTSQTPERQRAKFVKPRQCGKMPHFLGFLNMETTFAILSR